MNQLEQSVLSILLHISRISLLNRCLSMAKSLAVRMENAVKTNQTSNSGNKINID